jgi:hypothetical protein
MMNVNNATVEAFEVPDPSEISIASLKTAEKIQSYLNTVSIWCESIVSDICRIENETETMKTTDLDVYGVLRAYIEKLKLFIDRIDELEKLYSDRSDIQIDHQQSFNIGVANLLKRGIYMALIRACWLTINISNDPVKKCRIYYSCSDYFTKAIQIHRNINCRTNDLINEPLLFAVHVNILRSILQIVKAKKVRKQNYQGELELLQKNKKELLADISKQNFTVNDDFNKFLQTIESVLTKNRPADKSEKTYTLPDWVLSEQSPQCGKSKLLARDNVKKKSKKKKPKKRANKKGDRETKDEMKPIKTADIRGFLAALSISLKQLKEHQNKNSGQAHVNLSKNSESTETENIILPSSNLFNAEETKRSLQEGWNEAVKDPEAVKLGEPPSRSFTNK